MSSDHSFSRHCKLLIATALTLGALTTASEAYTMQEQQLCAGDAMRLCASEIPNVARITACMERQRDQLSEGCRAIFEVDDEATAAPAPAAPPRVTATAPRVTSTKASKPLNLVPSAKRG